MSLWPVRSLSLQRLLIFATVSQILGAVGVVGYLSFKNGERTVEALGNQIITATNYRVEQELEDYLSIPLIINRLNTDASKTGLLDINSPEDLERRLWNQLQAFEFVSYVYISSIQGGSVAVGRDVDDEFVIEQTDTYPDAGDYTLYGVDERGARSEPIQVIPDQDARERPWFQQPVAAQKEVWTEPFNYVDRESVIAISASSLLYDLAGELVGVATVDLRLERLSRFLRRLTPDDENQIYIVDRSGKLLASSDDQTILINQGRAEIIQASKSPNVLIRETAQNLEQYFGRLDSVQQPQRMEMDLEDQAYFVQVNPWQDSVGLDWLVVVMVPESKFMSQIHANTRATALFCILAAVGAALLATWIANRLSAPILKLSAASQTLAEASRQNFVGDRISPALRTSGIKEFKTLAQSFEQMSDQLQTSFAQLEDHSQVLEHKVKERTQALEEEIAEREQAQTKLGNSERKYRILHEGMQDAVLLLNERAIVDCNLAALRIFGTESKADIEGKTPADFSPTYQPDGKSSRLLVKRMVAKAIKSGTYNFEWLHCRQNGELFYAEIWLTSLQVGNERIIQAVVRDITARKHSEAALLVAKDAAEVANKTKSEFLANMSHELRSPLNAILGFAQVLEQSPTLATEHRENAIIIGRSGEHLLSLINNVLDMSKIEAGRVLIVSTSFDLYRLLDELRNMFRLRAEEKQLTLDFHYAPGMPPYVSTDQRKLRQILINLLSNAIKFTSQGSVCLRVGSVSQATESADEVVLTFEVEDTGFGIAKSEANKVFDPFVQTEAAKTASDGSGLGLPISREFAQLMGGDLTVESELGKGTTATLTTAVRVVPSSQVTARAPEKKILAIAPNQPQYRLLIVDDKPANRKLLRTLLQPLGFVLEEATNGREAVEISLRWQPHLVWMDMRMPILDGYLATQQIRVAQGKGAFKEPNSPKIIALSASSFREEQRAAMESGCDDFIHKPFRTAEIFEAMGRHLGVRYLYDIDAVSDEAADISAGSRPIEAEQLQRLPPQLLESLAAATKRLQWNRLMDVVERIRPYDQDLAEALATTINDFQYGKILQALGESALGEQNHE